ncbi:MAG: RimK/LysX family protein [Rhodanobacter sp.]
MPDPTFVRAADTGLIVLGWREWLMLPQLDIGPLRAKLDTGARSSSLHVDTLDEFHRDGAHWLRFTLRVGRRQPREIQCEAPSMDRRAVTDTGGRRTERWFIRTQVVLAGITFDMDVNLTDRRHMLFPLLLGRSALSGRFAIDPSRSHTQPRAPALTPGA